MSHFDTQHAADLTTQDVLELSARVDQLGPWEADDQDLGEMTLLDDALWSTAVNQLLAGLSLANG